MVSSYKLFHDNFPNGVYYLHDKIILIFLLLVSSVIVSKEQGYLLITMYLSLRWNITHKSKQTVYLCEHIKSSSY